MTEQQHECAEFKHSGWECKHHGLHKGEKCCAAAKEIKECKTCGKLDVPD